MFLKTCGFFKYCKSVSYVNASSTQVKNDIINKFESLKGDVSIVFATEFYFWFTKRIFSYSKPFAHVLLECSKPQQPYLN